MKILVINGSPKGKNSITLQTPIYLSKCFPEHSFRVLNVGAQIKSLERDFSRALKALSLAELIIFSYPVYTFIVPSQLHRFIELVKESGIDLSGKLATQISTSKHFYDITAHRFIADNCADLGLSYIKGLSADMDDLSKESGQRDAREFMKYVLHCAEKGIIEKPSVKSPSKVKDYLASLPESEKKSGRETVIVMERGNAPEAVEAMVRDFQAVYPYPTRVIDLAEIRLDGGCISCFNCAADGTCIYKDGFDSFLREEIQTADSIICAFPIRDHSMGSRFKLYDDRQFCNGHRTVTMGMPMGFIVCGELEHEENLRTIMEARCEVGHNFYCGAATDRSELIAMSERMTYALEHSYVQPQSFWGVGGMKIFRDLIYLMQGLMKADHEFYKEHGIYDFPQKQVGTLLAMKLVGRMMNDPKLKKKLGGNISEGMLLPYRKALESASPELVND